MGLPGEHMFAVSWANVELSTREHHSCSSTCNMTRAVW
jgi:hypothetical protein